MKFNLILFCGLFSIAIAGKRNPNDVSILDFGADSTGTTDSYNSFVNAIKSAKNSSVNVYVPPGKYIHSQLIVVEGLTLYGDGDSSHLHATNNQSAPVVLRKNNSGVQSLRLTTVSSKRMSAPWQDSVWCDFATNFVISDILVEPLEDWYIYENTRIYGVGGIFVYRCSGGKVYNNRVRWTWADGIHHTNGANNIETYNNTVEWNGDDGIAVVSYAKTQEDALNSTCYNITIHHNSVSNGVWGRGITVIGGHHVRITDNTVSDHTGSGIWLASESSYNTTVPNSVIVTRNIVSYVVGSRNCSSALSTLSSIGIDNGRVEFGTVRKMLFADNSVVGACREAFRATGLQVEDVVLTGNRLKGSFLNNVIRTTNSELVLIQNTLEGGKNQGVQHQGVGVFESLDNNFKGFSVNSSLAIGLYQPLTGLQLSNQSLDYTFNRLVQINGNPPNASYSGIDSSWGNFTSQGELPPVAVNVTLEYSQPLALGVPITFSSQEFLSRVQSGSNLRIVSVWNGVGGSVDLLFDDQGAVFTPLQNSNNYSFYYAVSSSFGVDYAQVSLNIKEAHTTPNYSSTGTQSSLRPSNHSINHAPLYFMVVLLSLISLVVF